MTNLSKNQTADVILCLLNKLDEGQLKKVLLHRLEPKGGSFNENDAKLLKVRWDYLGHTLSE